MTHKKRAKQGNKNPSKREIAAVRKKARALYQSLHRIEALPLYQKLLKYMPDDAEINVHLGQMYYAKFDFINAIPRLTHANLLMPDNADIRRFLFGALRDGNQTHRMLEMAEDFLISPLNESEKVLAFLAFATVCDWPRMEALRDQCIDALLGGRADAGLLPGFCLDILGMNNTDQNQCFALSCKTGRMAHVSGNFPVLSNRGFSPPSKRLKIGYLSGDFHNHAVGYFCYSICGAHDRSRFEIFCYSGTHHADEITNKFTQIVDHFIDVSSLNSLNIAKRIYADGIDVLVDLGGHTASSLMSVMLCCPAPVQITYLGFAATTGVKEIDFRITNHAAEGKDAQRYYTEKLLYLPDSFVCFGMRPACLRNTEPPIKQNNFITFGSFNNKRKMNSDVVNVWSKILKQVPNSKLALKTSWGDGGDVIKNLVRAFMDNGVALDQLMFIKYTSTYDEHIALYNGIDIALDPFPYTGTTTTCEALWMGVPVVTLVGESHASRVSYSILKSIAYEETLAFTEDEYIEKAVALAMNPDGLSMLRTVLHTLFEHSPAARPDLFTPALEAVYLDACRRKDVDISGINSAEVTLPMTDGVVVVTPRSLVHNPVTYVLTEQEDWYEHEIRFLRRIISPGMGVADVRSGHGCYAMSMAKQVSNKGYVVAIESDTRKATCLAQSVASNRFTNVMIAEAWSDDVINVWQQRSLDFLLLGALAADGLDAFENILKQQSPMVMIQALFADDMVTHIVPRMCTMGYLPFRLVPSLQLLIPVNDHDAETAVWNQKVIFCQSLRAEQLEKAGFLLRQTLDNIIIPDEENRWGGLLQQRAYTKHLLASWLQIDSSENHLNIALNAYAMAHHHTSTPAERYGYLTASLNILLNMDALDGNVLSLMTCARIADECGMYPLAGNMLEQAVNLLPDQKNLPDMPFLTVHARYDNQCIDAKKITPWLQAQLHVQLELNRHPSSWEHDEGTFATAEKLREIHISDETMQKRESVAKARRRERDPIETIPASEAKVVLDQDINDSLPGSIAQRTLLVCDQFKSELWDTIQQHCEKVLNGESDQWLMLVLPTSKKQAAINAYLRNHFVTPYAEKEMRLRFIIQRKGSPEGFVQSMTDLCAKIIRVDNLPGSSETRSLLECDQLSASLLEEEPGSNAERSCAIVDRLTPDIWRMIRAYCISSDKNTPHTMLALVPFIPEQEKISGYLTQFSTAAAHNIMVVKLPEHGVNKEILAQIIAKCSQLHVPAQTHTPLETLAIDICSASKMPIVTHDEQPVYTPEPMPPLENFKVTVLMPTWNRLELLQRSTKAILDQTYQNFTLIISDNASTDGTQEFCLQLARSDARVHYHRNDENIGGLKNIFQLFDMVETDLYVTCSDDDLIYPCHLQESVQAFRQHPSAGLVFGQCDIGDQSLKQRSGGNLPGNYTQDCVIEPQQMLLDSIAGNNMCWTSCMIRKSAVWRMIQYGATHWDLQASDVVIGEGDYFFNLLMAVCAPIAHIRVTTGCYTVDSSTYSSQQLGGGWGIEIRLRTVSYLHKMYQRIYGVDAEEKIRMAAMLRLFQQQLQTIQSSLSGSERKTHKKKLKEFAIMINNLEQVAQS